MDRGQGTRDKRRETRDKGRGTRDEGRETRDKERETSVDCRWSIEDGGPFHWRQGGGLLSSVRCYRVRHQGRPYRRCRHQEVEHGGRHPAVPDAEPAGRGEGNQPDTDAAWSDEDNGKRCLSGWGAANKPHDRERARDRGGGGDSAQHEGGGGAYRRDGHPDRASDEPLGEDERHNGFVRGEG